MSATRNPYYQLPGGAELPGDVRVSDTADASKTAADGWAASPAAVANAAPEMECGAWKNPSEVSNKNIVKINISFTRKHNTPPKAVIVSYRIYDYFYGELHLSSKSPTETGFEAQYIPIEIGNGRGALTVDWLAIW